MARQATGQVIERRGKQGITYAARVRAYGQRHYLSLGYSWEGCTRRQAGIELQNILADIRRGTWQPPQPAPTPAGQTTRPSTSSPHNGSRVAATRFRSARLRATNGR